MSAALKRLHAERRRYQISDDVFRAILVGQIGRESSKGITMSGANACIEQFKKHRPDLAREDEKSGKGGYRKRSDDPLVRKIYVLWTILRNEGVVQPKFPDSYVKRMAQRDRAEWCTPAECNVVIEGLKDWIIREGLEAKLNYRGRRKR